jgi:small subunit ribosomal protein S21
MKRFKKLCETEGIIPEFKRRQFHEKPSERRKRKDEAAKRRRLKKEKGT